MKINDNVYNTKPRTQKPDKQIFNNKAEIIKQLKIKQL